MQAKRISDDDMVQRLNEHPQLRERVTALMLAVGQKPITWRRRREVDLVHPRAVALLGLQLERGLEEVDVQ